MENIYDILKDAPRGLELWSSLCGECKLVSVYDNAERTNMRTPKGIIVRGKYADITDYDFTFDEFGRFSERGACLLYPSKTTSTWEFWQKRLLRRGDIVTDGDTLYLIKAELNELICNIRWAKQRRAELGDPIRMACYGYRVQKKPGDAYRYWVIQEEEAEPPYVLVERKRVSRKQDAHTRMGQGSRKMGHKALP